MNRLALLLVLPLTYACGVDVAQSSDTPSGDNVAVGDSPGDVGTVAASRQVSGIALSPVEASTLAASAAFDRLHRRCSARAPFVHTSVVAGVPGDTLGGVTLLGNELEMWATLRTTDYDSTYYQLVRMTRPSTSAPFALAAEPQITSTHRYETGLTVSRDGLSLYATVEVPSGVLHVPAGMEIRVAHRDNTSQRFGTLEPTGISGVKYPWQFSQLATNAAGDGLLASASFAAAWRIKEIPFAAFALDTNPSTQTALDPNVMAQGAVATQDGHFAYVGVGSWSPGLLFSIGLAEKGAGATKYGAPEVLGAPANPDASHGGVPQWLSSDECRLYYIAQAEGGGSRTLMVASKASPFGPIAISP